MVVNIRGIDFQENDNNDMGLEFVNLSHRYGAGRLLRTSLS